MRAAMKQAVKRTKGNRQKAQDSKAKWKEANKQKRKVRGLLTLALVGPLALLCLLYPLHSFGYLRLWKPAELSKALSNPDQAENLNLTHQYLDRVPDGVDSLKNLKVLILDQNEISELSESVFKLEKLEKLSVGYNQLKSLPPDLKKLDRLRELNVSGNPITELPGEVTDLRLLESLIVTNTKLATLPKNIDKLQNLKVLELRGNQLSSLPDKLSGLKNLEVLNLAGNKITSVPDLTGMPNLKSVSLRGTGLSSAEIDALRAKLTGRNVVITI